MTIRRPIAALERLILSAVMSAAVWAVDRRLRAMQARVALASESKA